MISCRGAAAEALYLFVQTPCHFADLALGESSDSKAVGAGKPLHLPDGYTLHGRLLNDLDQHRLAALALCDKKWDVSAAAQLRHHEIHCPCTGSASCLI